VADEAQLRIGLYQIELSKLVFKLSTAEAFHELKHSIDLIFQKKPIMYGLARDWLPETDFNRIWSCLWLFIKVLFDLLDPH
jgi:hypothetical protein